MRHDAPDRMVRRFLYRDCHDGSLLTEWKLRHKKRRQSPAHHVPPCKIARGAGTGKKPRRGLIPTGKRNLISSSYSNVTAFFLHWFTPVLGASDSIHVSRYVSKIIMLTASVEAICYKVRPLRDNTYPLMLRLTQHRKRKYISLGVSVLEKDWDREIIYLPCFMSSDDRKKKD